VAKNRKQRKQQQGEGSVTPPVGGNVSRPTMSQRGIPRRQFLSSALASLTAPLVLSSPSLAQAQTGSALLPLPTDANITVSVLVSGTWLSLTNPNAAPRTFALQTDLACYPSGITPSSDNFETYEFVTMQVPQEADWGGFYPADGKYTLVLQIADAQKRLGKVVVTDLSTGAVLASFLANGDGSGVSGQVTLPWEQDYMKVAGYDRGGQPLFVLAATNGQADAVVPHLIDGGFIPYRPAVIESAKGHYVFASNTPIGDPYNVSGVMTYLGSPLANASWSSANADEVNDTTTKTQLFPPPPFYSYSKRYVALDTASRNLDGLKVNDPDYLQKLIGELKAATASDPTPALSGIDLAPYSDNSGYWVANFSGTAVAVLAIPYRRTRNKGTFWDILAQGIQQFFKPGPNILTSLLLGAANAYLKSSQNTSGYFPGDVIAIGDVYAVGTTQGNTGLSSGPLPQDVTFQLSPDIAPPPGWTALPGQLSLQGAWTTPSPPGPISTPSQITFDANGKATLQLYKGWKYEVSGAYDLYQAGKNDFDTPVSGVIPVPCALLVLLILKVYTTSSDSGAIPATITILDSKGNQVGTGNSTSDGKGNYVFSLRGLSPGTYTVKATSLGPPRNPGVATITVVRGVEQDVTVQLGPIQYPHPPNP
jgi:hypothetical protein